MKRWMTLKKLMSALLIILLIGLTAAGCGGKSSEASQDSSTPSGSEEQPGDSADTTSDSEKQDGSFSTAYTAYLETKSDFVGRIGDGLSESQLTAAMDVLGMSMVELYMAPVAALGMDEETAKQMMTYLNATGDVDYKADGNHYTMSYKDEKGIETICDGKFDPKKDAAAITMTEGGKETLTFEYTKTSYGYASQYCIQNEDGTMVVYKGTLYGADGIIGVTSNATAKPDSILGNGDISKDFPKDCLSWYEAEGEKGTGQTSDGTAITFDVPPVTAEE